MKLEWWGSPLVQEEKYLGKKNKTCDKRRKRRR
jgi:hypothetical protein